MAVSITVSQLIEQLRYPVPPVVLDVRRAHVWAAAPALSLVPRGAILLVSALGPVNSTGRGPSSSTVPMARP